MILALLDTPRAGTPATAPGGWLHDLNPFIVRFTDTFGLRWYGFSYLCGFVAGYLLLRWLGRRGAISIPPQRAADAVLTLIVGVMVGGRLGYVLLYQPALLWQFSADLPFWGVLRLTQGGMASHGGMIGVTLAAWWISRGFKTEDGGRIGRAPALHVFDTMALIAPPGLFFGRLANFINGELLGRVVARPGEPAPWWGVRFPQEIVERDPGELVQTPAQLAAIDTLAFEQLLPNEMALPPARAFEIGYERLLEKIQQGNEELAARLEPLIAARAPSQLLQALAEGVVVMLVVWIVARRPRTPGVLTGVFLITYGLGRIATEFVRLADSGFAGTSLLTSARPLGLSRGQWLSTLMVLIGVALIVRVTRRAAPKMGGWATPAPGPAQPADSPS
ncbi:MAG: prolipoprotein diacylglyceryl transferase [Phycisphaerales bacterium JB040]